MNVIVKGKKGDPVDNIGGKLCAVVVAEKTGVHVLLRGEGNRDDYLFLANGLNEAIGAVFDQIFDTKIDDEKED